MSNTAEISKKYAIVEYHDGQLGIEAEWLEFAEIITLNNLKLRRLRHNEFKNIRTGGNGRTSLISWSSIPVKYQELVITKIGHPEKYEKYKRFKENLKADRKAIEFFANYQLQSGKYLPTETAKEYHTNAMFLNCLNFISQDTKARRKAMGGKTTGIWQALSNIVNGLQEEYRHTLPNHYLRLKEKTNEYNTIGYESLIHRNFSNQNSRKVDEKLENLILSIYIMKNKPYVTMVLDIYLEFLSGKVEIIDMSTGEIYQRSDFWDEKKNTYLMLSEATVSNYINNPKNRAIVDSKRNDAHYFNGIHRPHHHRRIPDFSLSKISFDDRDLVRTMKDASGKTVRAKAYYAYDVTSGALIGYAHSKTKDTDLFIDCMRNMFVFLFRNNIGIPMEAEVEHHLVNLFEKDMMKAGVLFPFVRFCNPGNSQEKRAEHFIKAKKYGFEKRYNDGIGRYHLTEANRPRQDKVWNENGMQVKEKEYTYEELVADDVFTINKYNNDLHPNQKLHKGLTRMEVLKQKLNKNLPEYREELIARYIGDKTDTSIRRNQYCRVQYEMYGLPKIEVINNLKPNNYDVTAYYLKSENGEIERVHLYQDVDFIATCEKIVKYNEATCEQTQDDLDAFTQQSKYVAGADKMFKDGAAKLANIKIIENLNLPEPVAECFVPTPTAKNDFDWVINSDFESNAFDEL